MWLWACPSPSPQVRVCLGHTSETPCSSTMVAAGPCHGHPDCPALGSDATKGLISCRELLGDSIPPPGSGSGLGLCWLGALVVPTGGRAGLAEGLELVSWYPAGVLREMKPAGWAVLSVACPWHAHKPGGLGPAARDLYHLTQPAYRLQPQRLSSQAHVAVSSTGCQCLALCCVQISLWDTAGEERFLSLSSCYYRGTDAVLLVYSVQSQLSFDSLPHWVCMARQHCPEAPIFLLGNKTDLEPCLPEDKAEKFSVEHRIAGRFNVSAKTGENVDRCVQDVVRLLVLESDAGCSRLTVPLQEAGSSSPCAC
nr:uncharacterized protein LOC125632935 isoform X2 [Caretta caretta]